MPLDDLDPRDELASAHLDGEASAEDDARVADDPELAARAAAMDLVRRAVASDSGPVDEARRERAIAAALASVDGPTRLAATGRRRGLTRRASVLGIAAAVVLLAAALAAGVLARPDHRTTTATAAAPKVADRPPAGTAESRTGAGGTAASPTTTVASPLMAGPAEDATASAPPSVEVLAMGSYPDLQALAAAVEGQISHAAPPLPSASPEGAAGAQACVADLRAATDAGAPVLVGLATVGGQAVVAIVTVDHAGVDHLATLTPAPACATLTSNPLGTAP